MGQRTSENEETVIGQGSSENDAPSLRRRIKLWWRRNKSAQISIGHASSSRGSAVFIQVDKKQAMLSPAGARILADHLTQWADHAEKGVVKWDPVGTWTVRYTVAVDMEPMAEALAESQPG